MRVLDNRLMAFNVRHADTTMPGKRFAAGASTVAMFKAEEYYPLLWQTLVVLGVFPADEEIVSAEWKLKIAPCFGLILKLRSMLTKVTHTVESLNELDVFIPL